MAVLAYLEGKGRGQKVKIEVYAKGLDRQRQRSLNLPKHPSRIVWMVTLLVQPPQGWFDLNAR